MLAPASSTHLSWSLRLSSFIMVNVLDVLAEIIQGSYGLNNCY